MQCEISHSGWLGQVSINHPQDLCCFGAVFECAVGGLGWTWECADVKHEHGKMPFMQQKDIR